MSFETHHLETHQTEGGNNEEEGIEEKEAKKEQNENLPPKTCKELLEEAKERLGAINGEILNIVDADGKLLCRKFNKDIGDGIGEEQEKQECANEHNKDVYNPTAPFEWQGETYILARVEDYGTCEGAQVRLFKYKQEGDSWVMVEDFPKLPLPEEGKPEAKSFVDGFVAKAEEKAEDVARILHEDGFIVIVKREAKEETKEEGREEGVEKVLIIGGVKTWPDKEHPDKIDYQTLFYKTSGDFSSLEKFAEGPANMKDIRLIQFKDDRFGVFTRPDEKGIRRIAYIEFDSLDQINSESLLEAEIVENLFAPGEWGGANALYLLENGNIGVLAHIAYMDEEGNRHYYPVTFEYNRKTRKATPPKIIVTKDNFPDCEPKKGDLDDVAFAGGLDIRDNGTTIFYGGLKDARSCKAEIPYPFSAPILKTL